jgi:group II intron reverse transcriptase/maturase
VRKPTHPERRGEGVEDCAQTNEKSKADRRLKVSLPSPSTWQAQSSKPASRERARKSTHPHRDAYAATKEPTVLTPKEGETCLEGYENSRGRVTVVVVGRTPHQGDGNAVYRAKGHTQAEWFKQRERMEELDLVNAPHRELEHLRILAAAEPTKRFGKLLKLVRQEVFLNAAWQHVSMNHGSKTPGVDGQTKYNITDDLIHRLAQELAEKRYQPQPVRRVYIPKKNSTKQRPLGIPTLRDRIVQAAVAQVLEALYEPIFCNSSHGFRPQRSTMHAIRQVASAYQAGATWVIEGDLVKCFDSLPHEVILNCLRKRIKDEGFIDLVRQMLRAGVMEDNQLTPTYSGTPQGGLMSPILANIVLHEFDCWMESHWQANPPPQTSAQLVARVNPEYRRLNNLIHRARAKLRGKAPLGHQNPEELQRILQEAIAKRHQTPTYLPRQAIFYCRYADDYVVILCNYAKADAEALKQAMAIWLQATLGVVQHPEKTRITHWRERFRFLGYDLRGQRNPSGTHWLRLTIPVEAEQELKQRLKRLCGYTQIPETDLFLAVNAQLRGWTQYYCYAHNAKRRMSHLTGVVFWLTAHYLGRKHRCSIKHLMRTHYGLDPKTGHHALFITPPDSKALFIWNKYPLRRSILTGTLAVQDAQPILRTAWARGHSYEQRLELLTQHNAQCQHCGQSDVPLVVHHPKRLASDTRNTSQIIQSAQEQHALLLCLNCHLLYHHGHWYANP